MAWQLIYTSALRTLLPGQSGYGTVARSTDLREALIQRLEQLSYYQHIAGPGASTTVPSHVVSAYRILDFRGSRYHVLSRIQDAGLDFTSRTNHLAHHLVFEPAELAGVPPPAIVLAQWSGWRSGWEEGPRFLEAADWGDLRTLPRGVSLPAVAWQAMTGDAGSAAGLLVRPYAAGCNLLCQAGEEATLLNLFAESLQLLDPDCRHPVKLWSHTFTTFFQAEDSPGDFIWRGCVEGTPGWQAIQRTADGALVPLRTVAAPANQLAKLAREGRPQIVVPSQPQPTPVSPSPAGSPTPLRLESRLSAWRKPPAATPPSTTRTVTPPRAITLDLTSARFWVPALLLTFVLLLGAFVWPGYLKSRVGGKSGSITSSTKSTLSAAGSGSLLPDLAPPAGSQRDQPKPKPGAEAPSPPPREALDALHQQIDNTATWFVVLDGEAPFTFPKSTELDGLLRKHLLNDKPLAEILECRVADRRIDLSGGPATPVELESNQTRPKQITARLPGGSRLVLDCDDWFNASRDATGARVPVHVKWANAPVAGAFTLLLRPVSSPPMLEPFRLVVLTGKPSSSSAPIHLSKTLLRPAHDGLEVLTPDLLTRVKAIQCSDAKARWQLRPSTANSAESDLIESLDAMARPAPGHELDFAAIRERLSSRLTQDRRKVERVESEAARLRHQIEDDRPLGEILAGHTNEMASLSSFAKARKRDVDCQIYLAYLKEVLSPIDEKLAPRLPPPDAKPDEARKALTDLEGLLSRHPRLQKKMADIPPGYFVKRWEVLARVPDLKLMETNVEKTRRTISQCESSLDLVPRDLADTPGVSLVLVTTSGRRHELIRFADPKPKPAP